MFDLDLVAWAVLGIALIILGLLLADGWKKMLRKRKYHRRREHAKRKDFTSP
jgi:hypothetical protein